MYSPVNRFFIDGQCGRVDETRAAEIELEGHRVHEPVIIGSFIARRSHDQAGDSCELLLHRGRRPDDGQRLDGRIYEISVCS